MGRGKAGLRRRENAEERRYIQEELDREQREEELKQNFDNVFFYKEAVDRLHADDPTRTYDEELLKILWGTKSELTTTGYNRLWKQKQQRETLEKVPTTVVLPPPPPLILPRRTSTRAKRGRQSRERIRTIGAGCAAAE